MTPIIGGTSIGSGCPKEVEDRMAFYDCAGPADGFPVVFLHGALGNRKMWIPQMNALAERYRVIALDLPAHGTLAAQSLTLRSATRLLADVLALEHISRAALVGFSLGGYVALRFAAEQPTSVAGLALAGSSHNAHGWLFWLAAKLRAISLTLSGGQRGLQRFERGFRKAYPAALIEPVINAGLSWKGYCQTIWHVPDSHVMLKQVRAYPGPLLILNGEYDTDARAGEMAFVAAARDARLLVLKGAGHNSTTEQPEAFTRAVSDFLQSLA
ncbi:MAG TPA: alpha/beta hydrolase [Ktedonobacterales bacterium]